MASLEPGVRREGHEVAELVPDRLRHPAAVGLGLLGCVRVLGDDAVSGALTTKALSRWASRRLFDRLLELGAVRELSGRPTFRIFGI